MYRDPVLHIKLSDLTEVLNELNYTSRTTGIKLANSILEASQPFQITDRYLQILQLRAKTKKKVERSMEADDVPYATVEKVNLYIMDLRKRDNPRAKVRGILKTSKQYLLLKEIAKLAVEFSEHFDIQPKIEGVREFLSLGIGFMSKYGLNRFKTYEERIYEAFESKVTVVQDDRKEDTREFYGIWQQLMLEHSGVDELINIDKDLVKFAHIIYARNEAERHKADYTEWITAQFEGLAFLDVIPEVYQFYGEGAKTRYDRYLNTLISANQEEDKNDVLNIYDKK